MHHPPPHRPPAVRRPRAAAPVIVQFGDTISIGGLLYTVTPTLTPAGAAPVPVPTPIPPPIPPPIPTPAPLPGVQIGGFRDASRNWLVPPANRVTAGSKVFIEGLGFGAATGTVLFHLATPLVVQSWSNTEVVVTAPPATPDAALPGPLDLRVAGAANLHASTMGFTVGP